MMIQWRQQQLLCLYAFERMRQDRRSFLSFRNSVHQLQSCWRRRRQLRLQYSNSSDNELYRDAQFATLQQVVDEGHAHAVTVIQAWYRSRQVQRKCNYKKNHSNNNQQEASASTTMATSTAIQAWYRSLQVQRKYNYKKNHSNNQQEAFAITATATSRATIAQPYLIATNKWKKQYAIMPYAARTIQAHWRLTKARNCYRGRQQACIVIQAEWRCWNCSKHFKMTVLLGPPSVKLVQDWWRSCAALAKRQRQCQRQCQLRVAKSAAAVILQSQWRRYRTVQIIKCQRELVILIQSWWRTILADRAERRRVGAKQALAAAAANAIIFFQASWRSALAKRQLQTARFAAVMVQACWRSALAKHQLREARIAAVMVQACWRSALAKRQLRDFAAS
jgi:hypothetical protein